MIKLSFTDGRETISDRDAINRVLNTVGVHVSDVSIPNDIARTLAKSVEAKLNDMQSQEVLEAFALDRNGILEQVRAAGRKAVIDGGGELSTSEVGVAPYPKLYDLMAMDENDRRMVRRKFGRLHVNSTDDGVGVDEVMTLVSGGPFTWFFMLQDQSVAKLEIDRLESAKGLRLSYPGLTPHGALMNGKDGIVVAHITGPKTWTMRYQAEVDGGHLLGDNPWIDFGALVENSQVAQNLAT